MSKANLEQWKPQPALLSTCHVPDTELLNSAIYSSLKTYLYCTSWDWQLLFLLVEPTAYSGRHILDNNSFQNMNLFFSSLLIKNLQGVPIALWSRVNQVPAWVCTVSSLMSHRCPVYFFLSLINCTAFPSATASWYKQFLLTLIPYLTCTPPFNSLPLILSSFA